MNFEGGEEGDEQGGEVILPRDQWWDTGESVWVVGWLTVDGEMGLRLNKVKIRD